MGTRGFTGIVIDGEVKISYNHWDSYPSGLGATTLEALRKRLNEDGESTQEADGKLHAAITVLQQQARDLKMVDEGAAPTETELTSFAEHADPNVGGSLDKPTDGTVQNYYQLLRDLQGNLFGQLELGIATDAHDFYLDSLFCEWGYLVDLDAGTFQVYEGFQAERHDKGRWAGMPTDEDIQEKIDEAKRRLAAGEINQQQFDYLSTTKYHAVALKAEWPLSALPEDKEFLSVADAE